MNDEEIKKEIRKFALQNAAGHEGQTRDKTILAKILGSIPELRQKVKACRFLEKSIVKTFLAKMEPDDKYLMNLDI